MNKEGARRIARHPDENGPVSSLIPAVARIHRTVAQSLLRDLGLAPGQELLLMMLWEREPLPQAEIIRELAVEPPTVTKMLVRMERAGVIVRARSTEDKRVMLISLTDKGRSLQEPVQQVWSELERRTVANLSTDDREQLIRLLGMVLEDLRNVP